ncbi:hypothetical protein ACHAQA_004623 [Verticillium albo-atrum]
MASSGLPPLEEFPPYSENPLGGDPMKVNINSPYNKGDIAWILVSTVLCWQITPAIGFLYAGMHRRKSALTMVFQSLFCACAVGIQYWLYGYSLYMSHTTNPILGDLSKGVLYNVLAQPSLASDDIPDILLAYWEWNPSGWLAQLGVLDFAGSGPVHIASGFGALAWAFMLGTRKDHHGESQSGDSRLPHFRPHNPFLVGIGTILIWFGWLAFNGASTANLTIRSVYVVMNTNLAACGGGLAWTLLEYFFTRKFSIIGFCSGIISGLVGITAAAGFVPVYTSALIGFVTSVGCFFTNRYKHYIAVDEGLDIFAIHGVGGVIGDVLTGFFAADFVPALDGETTDNPGGWWSGHWAQMGYQLAAAVTCAAWSFGVSCLLLFVIDRIPGMHIRATEEDEMYGLDRKYFADAEEGFESRFGLVTEGRSAGTPAAGTPPVGVPADGEQKRD